jgi:hypothetical protein
LRRVEDIRNNAAAIPAQMEAGAMPWTDRDLPSGSPLFRSGSTTDDSLDPMT